MKQETGSGNQEDLMVMHRMSCGRWGNSDVQWFGVRLSRFSIRLALATVAFLLTTTVALAGTVRYEYDELGRLKTTVYLDGTEVSYTLDAAGNRTNVATGVNTTPPSVPAGLTGSAPTSTQVNLSWLASTAPDAGTLQGYQIYRNGTRLAAVATSDPTVAPATSYTDTTTTCNTQYSYTVSAYDYGNPPNNSGQSTAWVVTTPITIPPSVPTGLTVVSATAGQVMLSWAAATDSCGSSVAYRILRNGVQVGTSANTTFTDTAASGATSYTYTVQAADSVTPQPNVSAPSGAVSVTTPPNAPAAPTASAWEPDFVTIQWSAVSGAALSGYKIYRNGSYLASLPAGTTTYNDTTTRVGTAYTYTVSAYDSAGESGQSAGAAVTTPTLYELTDSSGRLMPQVSAYYSAVGPVPGTCGNPGIGPCEFYVIQKYGAQATVRFSSNGTPSCPWSNNNLAPGYSMGTGSSCLITMVSPAVYGKYAPPSAPTNFTAGATSTTTVQLSWTAAVDTAGPGIGGYAIYTTLDQNGIPTGIPFTTTATSYTVSGLSPGTSYNYWIEAYDTAGNYSGAVQASVTIPSVPTVPTGLAGPRRTIFTGSYTVSWNPSSVSGSSIIYYNLFETNLNTGGTAVYTINAPGTSMSFNKGANGSDSTYQVRACTTANICSAYSTPAIEVTTCPARGCQ